MLIKQASFQVLVSVGSNGTVGRVVWCPRVPALDKSGKAQMWRPQAGR